MSPRATGSVAGVEDARLASLAKALGHPVRVQIVRLLGARGTCYVGDLATELPLAQSTISEHVRILREAGVVTSGSLDGRPCYCLAGESLATLRDALEALADPGCCERATAVSEGERAPQRWRSAPGPSR